MALKEEEQDYSLKFPISWEGNPQLRIPWTAQQIKVNPENRRILKYFGLVVRKDGMEKLVISGKVASLTKS